MARTAPYDARSTHIPALLPFNVDFCLVRATNSQFRFSYTPPLNRGRTYSERIAVLCSQWSSSMTKTLTLPQKAKSDIRARDYIVPAAVTLACAGAAYAGADTTFDPALQKFTDFLEGSGGKIITVLSLAGGLIALASGRFALGQVAVPVGVGIGVGTGVPIVTSVVTATI
jgi:hypothetical protein